MTMPDLAVFLYGSLVGHLRGENRTFDFTPSTEAIERFGPGSTLLSLAIPLTQNPPRHLAKRRRNWFRELLPEGNLLEYMASRARLAPSDTLGLLGRFGRDVAGAVEILDPTANTGTEQPVHYPVDNAAIREYLENPLRAPLGNLPDIGKASLAGVQPKMLLTRTDTGWGMPSAGAWSTHILKPSLPEPRETSIFDEEFGLRLARQVGLASYSSSLTEFDSLPTLVIERYDRDPQGRIHQEDVSQILGASGIEKYQEYGGVVSLKRVAATLTEKGNADMVLHLARQVTCAMAIGNLDLHAKNISVLHPLSSPPVLAPAYDCHPLAHRGDTDGRVAMSIAGEYRWEAITARHLDEEFRFWGIRQPRPLIEGVLDALGVALGNESPDPRAHPDLFPTLTDAVSRLRQKAI
jgi:serine/threonine-protein kinase HipA